MSAKKPKPQTLKGFRDFLPEEMRIRNFVLDTFRDVVESFGFEPLETPSLEYAETLLGKYGQEADRLVYTFDDRGGRKVGLIYDLTVPVSRVLAQYGEKIPKPFKRYQIQRVWRAEKPQQGRFREFVQCDFDIFGVESPLADAEIITVMATILNRCGLKDFTIRINSRPLLFSTLEQAGITDKNQQLGVLRIIDKLDKTPKEQVIEELRKKNFTDLGSDRWINLLQSSKPDNHLSTIISYLKSFGLKEKYYRFDPTLVRGLDYYTGPILEAVVGASSEVGGEDPERRRGVGSVAGGGRYDNLIKSLGGPSTPATGCSLGLDRIGEILKETELNSVWQLNRSKTQALVTIFPVDGDQQFSLEMATELRNQGIITEVYLDPTAKLDKQIKYADRKGIPYVLILGPEEAKNNTVTIKNLKTGEQETVDRKNISKISTKFQAPITK